MILLSRHLGPAQFGTYSLLYSALAFFGLPLALALNYIVVREASKRPEERERIFRSNYSLRLLLGAVMGLLAILVLPRMSRLDLSTGLTAAAAMTLLCSLWQSSGRFSYEAPLEADLRIATSAGANFAGRVLLFTVISFGVIGGAGLTDLVLLQSFGEGLATLVLVVVLARTGYPVRPAFDYREMRRTMVEGLPLIAAEVLLLAQTRADLLIVGALRGEVEAGLYSAPLRLVDALLIYPTVLATVVLPGLSRLAGRDRTEFVRMTGRFFKLLAAGGLAAAAVGAAYAEEIIVLCFGAEYRESGAIGKVLIWSLPLAFYSAGWRLVLVAEGRQTRQMLPMTLVALMSLLINYFIVPASGALGAAWCRVIAFATLIPLTLIDRDIRAVGWEGLKAFGWPLLLAAGLSLVVSNSELEWWIGGASILGFLGAFGLLAGWGRDIARLPVMSLSFRKTYPNSNTDV